MFSFFKKKYKPFSNLTLLAWTATEQHATQAKVKHDNGKLELLAFYSTYIAWLSRYFSPKSSAEIEEQLCQGIMGYGVFSKTLSLKRSNYSNDDEVLDKIRKAQELLRRQREMREYCEKRGKFYSDEILAMLGISGDNETSIPNYTAVFDEKSFVQNVFQVKDKADLLRCYEQQISVLSMLKLINSCYQQEAQADNFQLINTVTNPETPFSSLIAIAAADYTFYPFQDKGCEVCGERCKQDEAKRVLYKKKSVVACPSCSKQVNDLKKCSFEDCDNVCSVLEMTEIVMADFDGIFLACPTCEEILYAKKMEALMGNRKG